jgi:prepilin-type N-terminal cleavage/methylation domain-containing protein
VNTYAREDGFTLSELLIATTIMLMVTGAALTTFRNALTVNDTAVQLADANQNLRAGTNQLIRDLMMAGRIIGPSGIPVPTGGGVSAFNRPGPPGANLTFNLVAGDGTTLNLADITTGFQIGPTVNGSPTDVVTIMTVDEFMPVMTSPPPNPSISPTTEVLIAPDGSSITLAATSLWLLGDTVNDTPPIQVGDLILFKNPNGMAIQTVTSKDATHVYFATNAVDWFKFNQRNVAFSGTLLNLKSPVDLVTAFPTTTLFRALMITYYVDLTTTPGSPRLTRVVNHFTPQALAGVVEDLDLSYDLVDGVNNPVSINSLPYVDGAGNTYNSNQIRKVNIHMGVRSERLSPTTQDYVRNHISSAVDVRSLASIDRYVAQ